MAWSFTDWQCGMGVAPSCKGKTMDWSGRYAFKNLMDQVVPMAETLIVFGVQYVAEQLGPGVMKGINSLRCMLNSFGTNIWNFMAAGWQLVIYFGMKDMVLEYLNMGYEYVCTCMIDAKGIKSMLGASEASSAVFSSCSEGGANLLVKAQKDANALDEAKKKAAGIALDKAARTKYMSAVVLAMKTLAVCEDKATEPYKTKCYNAINAMKKTQQMVIDYWTQKADATKLKIAKWGLEGGYKGAQEIFPERFAADGAEMKMCETAAGVKTWGDATYPACITAYKASATGAPFLTAAEVKTATVECFTGNLKTNAKLTGAALCTLMPAKNGMSTYVQDALIACINPISNADMSGKANCAYWGGAWKAPDYYIGFDRPAFRTVGSKVPAEVLDANVSCLAADRRTVKSGKANCYPYWLENQKLDGVDQYLWLTNESIACTNAASVAQPKDKCKVKTTVACAASQITRLALKSGAVCVPTFTWKHDP